MLDQIRLGVRLCLRLGLVMLGLVMLGQIRLGQIRLGVRLGFRLGLVSLVLVRLGLVRLGLRSIISCPLIYFNFSPDWKKDDSKNHFILSFLDCKQMLSFWRTYKSEIVCKSSKIKSLEIRKFGNSENGSFYDRNLKCFCFFHLGHR